MAAVPVPAIDVERARRETPGTAHVAHLNNAGAALMPQPVLEAVVDYLQLEAQIGGYEAAGVRAEALDRVYPAAARLFGCADDEIAVLESATRAWQVAFASVPLGKGDRVLTSTAEYASNYMGLLHAARHRGVVVEVIPDDESGQVSGAALRHMLDDRVKLIAITHVPSNGGLVNPAAAIGEVARDAGVLFLLDACQSAGQIPIDVATIGCDFLVTTSRKYLRGPRGTGILYARRSAWDVTEPAMPDPRSAEWLDAGHYRMQPAARRFEIFEVSHAAKVGLGVALDYAYGWGIAAIWERIQHLAGRLRCDLESIEGVTVRDLGGQRCGIVTFTVEGWDAAGVRDALRRHGVNVWVSEPAITRLDMDRRRLPALVRASVHYYNTEEELARCCEAVAGLG